MCAHTRRERHDMRHQAEKSIRSYLHAESQRDANLVGTPKMYPNIRVHSFLIKAIEIESNVVNQNIVSLGERRGRRTYTTILL